MKNEDTKEEQSIDESFGNEKLYSTLYEENPSIYFAVDAGGRVIAINNFGAKQLGYTVDDLVGQPLLKVIYEDDKKILLEQIAASLQDPGNIACQELRKVRKDGSILWMKEVVRSVRAADGRMVTLIVCKDITESKRAEEQIKRSEEKYKNIVELTTDIIYASDRAGNQVFMNSAGYRLLETTPEEVIGKPWLMLVHPDDRVTTIKKFKEMIEQGIDVFDFENRLVSKNGRVINALHNIRVLRNEKGEAVGTQGIARDITERKRAEEHISFQTTVLSQVNDAIITFDNRHRIIYWNDGAERLYGWKSGEVIGRQVEEVTRHRWLKPEDEREAYSSLESTGSWRGEFVQAGKSGDEIDVEASIRVLRDEKGETLGFIAVMRDITERKRIEQRLRLLSAAIEEAPNGIQIIDPDGRIVFSNKAVKTIYGFSPEEFRGKHVNELNADPEFASKVILPSIKETGRWVGEVMVKHKDRRIFPILLNASMIKDSHGNPIALVGIITDITERRRAEAERERWAAELARSNAELEQFAYVASHDLQEPLRMVTAFTQLLAKRYRGKMDKSADEFIVYIVDGTMRMQRMIEDLLAYSRVGTRGKPFEPADCEDMFNQAVTNLKVTIDENKAEVTHDALPTVMADPTQMVQLLQNLTSNAIKFRKKEEPPRIHIMAKRRGDEWVFSVRDNGIGISPEFQSRLFQIFQREHAASEYPGTGIGLAICKKIVERHGGRIWVESVRGQGSTFYFTLPVRKSEKRAG